MFGFPKADRKDVGSFAKNYLKTVIFQVKFQPTDLVIKNKGAIIDLYKDLFPRSNDSFQSGFQISLKQDQTPILNPMSKENQGFELRSADGQKILSFTKDVISYTISGKEYKNFENILRDFDLLNQIFDMCEIKSFNRVAIRKLNVIDFSIPVNQEATPMDILSMVLNSELLNNLPYFPSAEHVQQNIHSLNYVNKEDHLNLRYGLIVPRMESKKGQILIDIDLFKTGKTERNKLLTDFEAINLEIFNIFNWALSEEALNGLKH